MKNIEDNATIKLVSTQIVDGEESVVDFSTTGNFYIKDSRFFVLYNEHKDMGMDNSSVLLKIEENSVTMRRSGDYKAVMVYKEKEATDFIYYTPFGEMKVKLKTEYINNQLTDRGGTLELSYLIFMNGEEIKNTICLKVKSERTGSI